MVSINTPSIIFEPEIPVPGKATKKELLDYIRLRISESILRKKYDYTIYNTLEQQINLFLSSYGMSCSIEADQKLGSADVNVTIRSVEINDYYKALETQNPNFILDTSYFRALVSNSKYSNNFYGEKCSEEMTTDEAIDFIKSLIETKTEATEDNQLCSNIDPVSKHELLLTGQLGTILGTTVLKGEMFVVGDATASCK